MECTWKILVKILAYILFSYYNINTCIIHRPDNWDYRIDFESDQVSVIIYLDTFQIGSEMILFRFNSDKKLEIIRSRSDEIRFGSFWIITQLFLKFSGTDKCLLTKYNSFKIEIIQNLKKYFNYFYQKNVLNTNFA